MEEGRHRWLSALFLVWEMIRSRMARLAKTVLSSWPSEYVLRPTITALFIAGPTTLVTFRDHSGPVNIWLSSHDTVYYLCLAWPVVGLIGVNLCRKASQKYHRGRLPNDEVLMKLLVALDNVVGSKSDRFARYSVESSRANPGLVFSEITQPEAQMACIGDAVYQFFEATKADKDATFRVALARMGPKHIEEFVCFNPKDKPPTGRLEDYQKDWCGFTKAKKQKDVLIVSNIAHEMQKRKRIKAFADMKGGSHDGAMIVYPISHRGTKDIVYCLSVLCSVPEYFRNNKRERAYYGDIMEKFGKRIELEHSLYLIKGKVNGYGNGRKDSGTRED